MNIPDDSNILVLGPTQNGKTTLANRIHRYTSKIGVFFNHDDEPFVTGKPVTNTQEMLAQFSQGGKKIDYQLPMFDTNPTEKLEELVKMLMVLGEEKGGKFRLTIDEAHEIAYQGSQNTPVHLAAKRGQKRGVYVTVITQDPATLSKSIVRQCEIIIWVGPMSNNSKKYMKDRWDLSDSLVNNLAKTDKYHYTAINRNNEIVDSGPTK